MTLNQIKTEIQRALNDVPGDVLQDVLDYLKSFQGKTESQIAISRQLQKILSEDKALLERLAQ